MGIFFLFYRFDNKYTARGDQAIQGILYVPDDDSVHYTGTLYDKESGKANWADGSGY